MCRPLSGIMVTIKSIKGSEIFSEAQVLTARLCLSLHQRRPPRQSERLPLSLSPSPSRSTRLLRVRTKERQNRFESA